MIDFVGIPPGVPGNNLAPIRNSHGGARYVQLDAGV